MLQNEFIWAEKYRPKSVEDLILPERHKALFAGYVKAKKVPHLLLSGSPGIGKTSTVRAMLDELDADYKFYNASLDRNIDVLRYDIFNYASSVSFFGGKKYVL